MKYTQLLKAIDSASQELLGRAAAAVNQALVIRNWLIGAYIVEFEQRGEDRAKHGTQLLSRLAADLKNREVSGASPDMLERMRQLYLIYPQLRSAISAPLVRKLKLPQLPDGGAEKPARLVRNFGTEMSLKILSPMVTESREEISAPLVRKSWSKAIPLSASAVLRFSWTQLIELIRLNDPLKRAFYENECLKGNWSKRQLQRQIGSLLYERTGLSSNKAAVVKRAHRQEPHQTIEDLIRDPYVLEFTGLAERPEFHEAALEKALLDDLQAFLLELGTGFCFEARQFRVTVGNDHEYLDLVFYHRLLRCHVLLDLKVRAFRHADAGQMNYYVNYFRNRVMAPDDSPPVGIILCSDRDKTKVEFATAGMDNKLFVSRYLVGLPTPEQLSRFVERDRARFEALVEQQLKSEAPAPNPRSKMTKAPLS